MRLRQQHITKRNERLMMRLIIRTMMRVERAKGTSSKSILGRVIRSYKKI